MGRLDDHHHRNDQQKRDEQERIEREQEARDQETRDLVERQVTKIQERQQAARDQALEEQQTAARPKAAEEKRVEREVAPKKQALILAAAAVVTVGHGEMPNETVRLQSNPPTISAPAHQPGEQPHLPEELEKLPPEDRRKNKDQLQYPYKSKPDDPFVKVEDDGRETKNRDEPPRPVTPER